MKIRGTLSENALSKLLEYDIFINNYLYQLIMNTKAFKWCLEGQMDSIILRDAVVTVTNDVLLLQVTDYVLLQATK